MTIAQRDIQRFVERVYADTDRKYHLQEVGSSEMDLTDYTTGKRMRLMVNLYGDILDSETRKVIAVSDLQHDLLKLGASSRPKEWTTQNENEDFDYIK